MEKNRTRLPSLGIHTWTEESLDHLAADILEHSARPLILVDGAAGSGKTTLAQKLASALDANLVHTDDVSWNADPIRWDGEMLTGIVTPWKNGTSVAYKPDWCKKEKRPGYIEADADRPLIIEGMGACRKTLRAAAAYSIWVDTEPETARARVVARDLANGENGGTAESVTEFADWWDSLLNPLFLEEEPWNYVDVIVSGSLSDVTAGKLMLHVPCF